MKNDDTPPPPHRSKKYYVATVASIDAFLHIVDYRVPKYQITEQNNELDKI